VSAYCEWFGISALQENRVVVVKRETTLKVLNIREDIEHWRKVYGQQIAGVWIFGTTEEFGCKLFWVKNPRRLEGLNPYRSSVGEEIWTIDQYPSTVQCSVV
jgi:hypothetical protein